MWSVKRVDETAARDRRPSRRLYRARDLECQFIKLHLTRVVVNLSLAHEPAQVSISRHVVEPVVMHADVGDMRGHMLHRTPAAYFQKPLISGCIKLQHCRAKLKPLRPLRPAACGVLPLLSENRCALGRTPAFLDGQYFLTGQVKESLQLGNEFIRGQLPVDFDRHVKFVES